MKARYLYDGLPEWRKKKEVAEETWRKKAVFTATNLNKNEQIIVVSRICQFFNVLMF
jgi:hypothetical protein